MSVRARVEKVVDEILRPLLAVDEGEIHLEAVTDDEVIVRLTGPLSTDPGVSYVKRGVIEPALQHAFGSPVRVRYAPPRF